MKASDISIKAIAFLNLFYVLSLLPSLSYIVMRKTTSNCFATWLTWFQSLRLITTEGRMDTSRD